MLNVNEYFSDVYRLYINRIADYLWSTILLVFYFTVIPKLYIVKAQISAASSISLEVGLPAP
jgi:hypothetical protein